MAVVIFARLLATGMRQKETNMAPLKDYHDDSGPLWLLALVAVLALNLLPLIIGVSRAVLA